MADLSAPAKYRAATEYEHWPKCYRCSCALSRPYPVEHFGVAGREPGKKWNIRYDLILDVKCSHGEVRRVELENSKMFGAKLWGIAGGMGLVNYRHASTQRVRVEIPRKWGGTQTDEEGLVASATEQVACSRIWVFAPGRLGRHGVLYRPGPSASKHRLETVVK